MPIQDSPGIRMQTRLPFFKPSSTELPVLIFISFVLFCALKILELVVLKFKLCKCQLIEWTGFEAQNCGTSLHSNFWLDEYFLVLVRLLALSRNGLQIVDPKFQILKLMGFSNSVFCLIADFKTWHSGFQRKVFPGFRNPLIVIVLSYFVITIICISHNNIEIYLSITWQFGSLTWCDSCIRTTGIHIWSLNVSYSFVGQPWLTSSA